VQRAAIVWEVQTVASIYDWRMDTVEEGTTENHGWVILVGFSPASQYLFLLL
jgi:hypothetical protein